MYISMGHREPASAAVCVRHLDKKTERKEQGVVFDWFVTGRLQTQVYAQLFASRAGQPMSQVATQIGKDVWKTPFSVSRYVI
jgi:hypothetical protein